MKVLFAHNPTAAGPWQSAFAKDAPGWEFLVWEEGGDYADVDYIITWKPPAGLLAQTRDLKAVVLLSAGADHLALNEFPANIDVLRMCEPGLTRGMIEYVTFAVQGIHRGFFGYARQARDRVWERHRALPAGKRSVGIMGLGALGSAVLTTLKAQGFEMRGWSRSAKSIDDVQTFAGEAGLPDFLSATDILVCLVPLTAQTQGLVGRAELASLPRGAAVVNVARGGIVDESELLDALDSGHVGQAVLDVFETEPLPSDHRFWSHPQVFMTPHIASVFQPETAAVSVIRDLTMHAAGHTPASLVDRRRGY